MEETYKRHMSRNKSGGGGGNILGIETRNLSIHGLRKRINTSASNKNYQYRFDHSIMDYATRTNNEESIRLRYRIKFGTHSLTWKEVRAKYEIRISLPSLLIDVGGKFIITISLDLRSARSRRFVFVM